MKRLGEIMNLRLGDEYHRDKVITRDCNFAANWAIYIYKAVCPCVITSFKGVSQINN